MLIDDAEPIWTSVGTMYLSMSLPFVLIEKDYALVNRRNTCLGCVFRTRAKITTILGDICMS